MGMTNFQNIPSSRGKIGKEILQMNGFGCRLNSFGPELRAPVSPKEAPCAPQLCCGPTLPFLQHALTTSTTGAPDSLSGKPVDCSDRLLLGLTGELGQEYSYFQTSLDLKK